MKQRSLAIIGIILFWGFGGMLALSIYSYFRLQSFQETLSITNQLLITWNRSEAAIKELFMTYDLERSRGNWLVIRDQFKEDFKSFSHSPGIDDIVERDMEIRFIIEMMKIYWSLNEQRLDVFDQKLKDLILEKQPRDIQGDQSPTPVENIFTRKYSDESVDLFGDSMWGALFNQSLTKVSQQIQKDIQVQAKRLQFTYLLLSVLIFGAVGIFVLYRMAEMKRSQNLARNHAMVLSAEIDYRKRAEELLQSERDKLNSVMNALSEGIYIVNSDFVIEYQNDILDQSHNNIIGRKCFVEYMKASEPCPFCLVQDTIKLGKMQIAETVLENEKNCELIFSPFTDIDGNVKAVILMRDVTEIKRLEAETMRAGHLASIGELAAGVAHEINNPINGIISVAEILIDQYQEKNEDDEIPAIIIKEGDRIAQIVKNLLSFAQNRREEYHPAKIHDIMADSLGLIGRQIDNDGIRLTVATPDLPEIRVRSHEIQQVFLNIISNARYALNQRYQGFQDGKTLEITAETTAIGGKGFIRTTFIDHGTGIHEDKMDKICNPFFSTKPKGEGTGLGLSISHGIVKSHGGRISFQSIYGRYTKVFVDLPFFNADDLPRGS